MKIVTVATHESGYFKILQECCKKKNLELIVLGKDEYYYNHHFKDDKMIEFTNNCNKKEIILFLDGFDSILSKNFDINEVEKKFIETKKNIIVSTEDSSKFFYLQKIIFNSAGFIPTENEFYLNTGMYIGYADHINSFLKYSKNFITDENCKSNQRLWQDVLKVNKELLFLDTESIFFRNLSNNKEIEKMMKNIYKEPFVLSCPTADIGLHFDKYLTYIGYKMVQKKKIMNLKFFFRKIFFYNKRINIVKFPLTAFSKFTKKFPLTAFRLIKQNLII